MNLDLMALSESATVQFADRVRALEMSGRSICKLQTGDPDFRTHQNVIDGAFSAINRGMTHYASSKGLPNLRSAIAEKLAVENGIKADPDQEILVVAGGVHGVYIALKSLLQRGDEVLIAEPYWMPYRAATVLAGGVARTVSTIGTNFKLTPDLLRQSLNDRSRVLILNSPSNPAGMVYTKDELLDLCRIAVEFGLYVISDEVYEHIVFDERSHFSPASDFDLRDRIISIFSLSKSYAMTGWRVGYVVASKALCQQMLKVLQYSITNVAPFVQEAAYVALSDPEVMSYRHAMVAEYKRRRAQIHTAIVDGMSGIVHLPMGAFYCLIDMRSKGLTSLAAADHFLNEYGVAFTPGTAFGETMEGFLRMTFAASAGDIQKGLAALRQAL